MTSGDDYRRVSPGDKVRFPADLFNDLVEVAKWWRGQRHARKNETGRFNYNGTTCLVQNNSGADVGMFGILGIDAGFVIAPSDNLPGFQQTPLFKGVAPAIAAHRANFVVTLEPIANGIIGRAVMSGLVPVYLSISDGLSGARFAKLIDGETGGLQLSYAGLFPVVALESGTGNKWGIVELVGSPSRLVLGHVDADVEAPGTVTVSLHAGAKAAETDTSENLTAVLLRYSHLSANQPCHVLCDSTGEEIVIGDPCP